MCFFPYSHVNGYLHIKQALLQGKYLVSENDYHKIYKGYNNNNFAKKYYVFEA